MKRRWRFLASLVSVAAALVLAGAVALAVNIGGEETMTLRDLTNEFYRQQAGAISWQLRHASTRTTERHYLDRRPRRDDRAGAAIEALNIVIADDCKVEAARG